MRVGILYSRVRAEEKLLFEAFDKRGVDLDLIDDNTLTVSYTHLDVYKRQILHGLELL